MLGDLDDILDRIDAIKQARFIDEDGKDLPLDGCAIEFKDVSFSYSGSSGKQALRKASFTIPEGTTCAIVGPSVRERPR